MVSRVVLQKWKSFDGQEWPSESAAQAWEDRLRSLECVARVVEVLERSVRNQHFSSLLGDDSLFPYGYRWNDDQRRLQQQFLDDLGALIIEKWDELKRAIDAPTVSE